MTFAAFAPLRPIQSVCGPENYLMIEDRYYKCNLTSSVPSTAFSLYRIDYVDLDYGIIGANYSIGLDGPAKGGGTGYVLMKFQFSGHDDFRQTPGLYEQTTNYDDVAGSKISPGQYQVRPLKEDEEIKD